MKKCDTRWNRKSDVKFCYFHSMSRQLREYSLSDSAHYLIPMKLCRLIAKIPQWKFLKIFSLISLCSHMCVIYLLPVLVHQYTSNLMLFTSLSHSLSYVDTRSICALRWKHNCPRIKFFRSETNQRSCHCQDIHSSRRRAVAIAPPIVNHKRPAKCNRTLWKMYEKRQTHQIFPCQRQLRKDTRQGPTVPRPIAARTIRSPRRTLATMRTYRVRIASYCCSLVCSRKVKRICRATWRRQIQSAIKVRDFI